MDYGEGKFNIGPMSPRGAGRDFLSSGLSLMGLNLLADIHFECVCELPPHPLELSCEGDLKLRFPSAPSFYELRGAEVNTSRESWGLTHTPLFLMLN